MNISFGMLLVSIPMEWITNINCSETYVLLQFFIFVTYVTDNDNHLWYTY